MSAYADRACAGCRLGGPAARRLRRCVCGGGPPGVSRLRVLVVLPWALGVVVCMGVGMGGAGGGAVERSARTPHTHRLTAPGWTRYTAPGWPSIGAVTGRLGRNESDVGDEA